MPTKLTLWLDHDLIEQAHMIACQQNKSLAQLVEEYFLLLTKTIEEIPVEELPPITQSLSDILADGIVEEEDYHRHLEKKYL